MCAYITIAFTFLWFIFCYDIFYSLFYFINRQLIFFVVSKYVKLLKPHETHLSDANFTLNLTFIIQTKIEK